MDLKFPEVIVQASYTLNGTVADTFPVDEEGTFWISYRKLQLGLRLDREEKMLHICDTDFVSSLFIANNTLSSKSASNSEFDRIIFWKLLGSIGTNFKKEIHFCSESTAQELLKQE